MVLTARPGAPPRTLPDRAAAPAPGSADRWILLGIVVVAAALRFATLTSQSYWLDESQAAHELSLSFGAMLHAWSGYEWNPPLYEIVAWPWAKLLGTGPAALRALSAIFGIAVVALLYLCGRELVSRRAGLAAAALAAVNPFMIWYSQEAREYMLMALLCTASLLFFARAFNRRPTVRRDLLCWAVLSALAVLTMYFSGFLVAAEGLALVYRLRSRPSVAALLAQAVVLAPWIPHVVPQLKHPATFITSQGLVTRMQQVPVTFALNTLYKGPLVQYGLVGAAVGAAIVLALLLIGASDRELRGAGLAAGLAGFVIAAPLLLALAGRDDFLARGLMGAWPPLAVVFGAACTGRGARLTGAAFGVVLLGLFAWSGVKIDTESGYQRPDWRGVASALGTSRGTRVVVADDGEFATGPLSIYLPRVAWAGPGHSPGANLGPETVTELDIVGGRFQRLTAPLPAGVRLIGSSTVTDGHRVVRLALTPRSLTAPAASALAASLLTPAPTDAAAIFQPADRTMPTR